MITSTTKLIVHSIFLTLCLVFFIICFVRPNQWRLVFYLTLLSFWTICFYFLAMVLVSLRLLFLKRESPSFFSFMTNHFFKYAFPFSMVAFIVFWVMVLMGQNFIKLEPDFMGIVIQIFLHGCVQGMVITDIFITDHAFIPTYIKDMIILCLIYLAYSIWAAISMYIFNNPPYPFMAISSVFQSLVAMLIVVMLLLHLYFIYQWTIKKKYGIVIQEVAVYPKTEHTERSLGNCIQASITSTEFMMKAVV